MEEDKQKMILCLKYRALLQQKNKKASEEHHSPGYQ